MGYLYLYKINQDWSVHMSNSTKSAFSGRLGYVLAVASSAVGLGNIWRFPYLAAKYGGGMFLLTYLILAITFGFTLLMCETTLGRKTGKSPIGAFKALGAKKLMFGGWINALVPFIIVPYYCVIGGWVCRYFYGFITGEMHTLVQDSFFTDYISDPIIPSVTLLIFGGCTLLIASIGVEKGIEKVSKVLMPLLIVIAIFLSIYSLTQPGAMEGLKYYLTPDFSNFSFMTVVAAMGQLFFSLSLAMGVLFTYGSYLKKDIDIEKSIGQVEIVDTLVAFLAGLMIVPAVFIFSNGDTNALQAGPSLMFVTMPKVFESMPAGAFMGGLFFLLIFFAAVTSSISLVETCISTIVEKTKLSRKAAIGIMGLEILAIGIPCSLGFGPLAAVQFFGMSILDFLDFISNYVMMPIGAICTCLLILKVTGIHTVIDEVKLSSKFRRQPLFEVCLKYITIPALAIILVSYVLQTLGVITI